LAQEKQRERRLPIGSEISAPVFMPVFAALFGIAGGRTRLLFEHAGKIALIVIAYHRGDIGQAQTGLADQLLSPGDADIV